MRKANVLLVTMAAAGLICLAGCSIQTKDRNEKLRDIEFTVLGEESIPEELQAIAVYLACDASPFTTGADFVIDGAFTCF